MKQGRKRMSCRQDYDRPADIIMRLRDEVMSLLRGGWEEQRDGKATRTSNRRLDGAENLEMELEYSLAIEGITVTDYRLPDRRR